MVLALNTQPSHGPLLLSGKRSMVGEKGSRTYLWGICFAFDLSSLWLNQWATHNINKLE